MSMTDPYAPRRNPAAEIEDLKPRKLPEFLRQPGVDLDALEAELDQHNREQAARDPLIDPVAGLKLLLSRLTYSEMKAVAGGILQASTTVEKPVSTPGEMADALEAWSKLGAAA
jgi:hypothetical protein